MSVARVKNIIIGVLVLVNVFFLTIIVIGEYSDAREARQAVENVCAILLSNGISITSDSIKPASSIRAMRTVRDVEFEEAIARSLLGQVEMIDQGVIYLYENAISGSAKFSSAGDFEVWMNEGIVTNDEGTLNTVLRLLRDMQLETAAYTVNLEGGDEVISVICAYREVSIFNCSIDFMFSGGSLVTVRGRYVAGIEPAAEATEIAYVGTALLGLMAAVERGDAECSEIKRVEAGYIHSVIGSFGEGLIAPAWLVTTDAGRYAIDSATGDIRSLG